MKFSLYSKKNLFDEMQEQTMRRIEARGFWLLWAGLLLAILVQIVLRTATSQMVGGFIIFNVAGSLIACVAVTVVIGLAYGDWLIALIPGVIAGVLCFVLLQVCMHVSEKRRKELDNPKDEE